MKHRSNKKILSRKSQPRKHLMRNMATSLILYEKMTTTRAKAKALKPFIEKIITTGKISSLTSRKKLIGLLYSKKAVKKVLEVLSPKFKDSKGGYTRIIHLGTRKGDGAFISRIEFI